MAMLRVANCPSQDLALTNAAFVSSADSDFVPYAELGVRDEVGVGGADERGVGERQILTRAVCDPQHRHGDLWMVGQAPRCSARSL